ncbi:MAG: phosphate ABC transporter permease subunit PstC [Oscillospiraceae bacterium]|nr:phosphate ABC transporter permease subunit PstC [Oscillospiraceae bacterium]
MNNQTKEKLARNIFFAFALSSILAVVLISVFIFAGGMPALKEIGVAEFVFGTKWKPTAATPHYGVASMIVGSLLITLGAVIIGVPVGIFSAVFLSSFCPGRLHRVINPAVNLLAGIPSVIYGFFGIIIIVPFVRNVFGGNGNSILAASILLGIMILPTIVSVSQSAIRAVPAAYYEGAVALGATKEQAVFKVVLPAAKSGVLAGVILGIGRSIGETMAVQMVAGNQPRITFDMTKGIRTMTTNIVLEMAEAADLHRSALIATGALLFLFILVINSMFFVLKRRMNSER